MEVQGCATLQGFRGWKQIKSTVEASHRREGARAAQHHSAVNFPWLDIGQIDRCTLSSVRATGRLTINLNAPDTQTASRRIEFHFLLRVQCARNECAR